MRRSSPAVLLLLCSCGGWGSGSAWVQEGQEQERAPSSYGNGIPPKNAQRPGRATHTLGAQGNVPGANEGDKSGGGGRLLGTFRNTYYDFPREQDYSGATVDLFNASCQPIAKVPKAFHDAVCVQGSGALARGGTVSFAKRDCPCAEVCPRTSQKICFEALDPAQFPYGRGAAGRPITPLRSVAADTSVLPLGTVIYVPELDGLPRGDSGDALDGCFVVEDRGMKVKGEHVDFFTGSTAVTAILNDKIPSNQGVSVFVSSPRCAHLGSR